MAQRTRSTSHVRVDTCMRMRTDMCIDERTDTHSASGRGNSRVAFAPPLAFDRSQTIRSVDTGLLMTITNMP